MRSLGFEWPAPGGQTCGAEAFVRGSDRVYSCRLRRDHNSLEHRWHQRKGDLILSASWIGDRVFIGPPAPKEDE